MLALLALVVAAGTATTGAGPHAGGPRRQAPARAARRHGPDPLGHGVWPRGLTSGAAVPPRPQRRAPGALGRAQLLLGSWSSKAPSATRSTSATCRRCSWGSTCSGRRWCGWPWCGSTTGSPTAAPRPTRGDGAVHGAADRAELGADAAVPMTGPVHRPSPSRSTRPRRGGRASRPALAGHRVERPDQPDVVRHLRVPEAVRLQPRQGHQAHARRAPQGPGRGQLRASRTGRARRLPAPRARAVGHHGAAPS